MPKMSTSMNLLPTMSRSAVYLLYLLVDINDRAAHVHGQDGVTRTANDLRDLLQRQPGAALDAPMSVGALRYSPAASRSLAFSARIAARSASEHRCCSSALPSPWLPIIHLISYSFHHHVFIITSWCDMGVMRWPRGGSFRRFIQSCLMAYGGARRP